MLYYQHRLDVSQLAFQPNPACGALKFTNRGSFVEDFSSAQAVGAIGAAYPPATGNQGPPYSLNASVYSTSTQGLFSVQTSFFTAPFSIVDFTVGSDGMYDRVFRVFA